MSRNTQQTCYKHILVALDGSADSLAGGRFALAVAKNSGAAVRVVHVYDTKIHNSRFREMEPGLPKRYRTGETLGRLRMEHDSLMSDGFRALSLGYMEDFLQQAENQGVPATYAAVEGRNYIGILNLLRQEEFDLAVLGATGLGAQGDGVLGSTVLRVLRGAPCDILVARTVTQQNRPQSITACIDGSGCAGAAAQKAACLAAGLGWDLHLFAAYDVAFHRTIFKTMARSLSAARQQEIGLDRQEEVHEELIDKSLEALYGSFLRAAAKEIGATAIPVTTSLQPGKAYRAIVDQAGERGSGLIVLGRHGHNHEESSDIGSNAEGVARSAPCHVLVCSNGVQAKRPAADGRSLLEWDDEALQSLERIPAQVRTMAKRAIEEQAAAAGEKRVTLEVCRRAAGKFGMA